MSRSPRCNVAVNCTRWQKYLAASLAGTAIGLGSQLDLDADITVVEVGATIADRTPDDGYFDVFGPYTFGQPGASFWLQHISDRLLDALIMTVGPQADGVGFTSGGTNYASNLEFGTRISSQNFVRYDHTRFNMAWGYPPYTNSQFGQPGVGYLGFRFDVGKGSQYGWAEIDMHDSIHNTATLIRYAWGEPGDQVFAGQIPEPNALGMLALGAVGIIAWRRKRFRG